MQFPSPNMTICGHKVLDKWKYQESPLLLQFILTGTWMSAIHPIADIPVKCQHCGGARGRLRGSPKSEGIIIWSHEHLCKTSGRWENWYHSQCLYGTYNSQQLVSFTYCSIKTGNSYPASEGNTTTYQHLLVSSTSNLELSEQNQVNSEFRLSIGWLAK